MDPASVANIVSLVDKMVVYNYVKYRGKLPPEAPKETYDKNAVFMCTESMKNFYFQQDYQLLHPKVLHRMEYPLYSFTMGDIITKYSVYTDDFIRQYLLLNSMGFDKHYGYEKVPIPFMPQYRGSSRGGNIDGNESALLDIKNVAFPLMFLIGGLAAGLFIFIMEQSNARF